MKTVLFSSLLALLLVSCQTTSEFDKKFGKDSPDAEVTITRIDKPIVLDGKLDEEVWKQAPVYELAHSWYYGETNPRIPKRGTYGAFQGAKVRLLADDKYIYVGVENVDTDVVQKCDKDQEHLYKHGDLIEVFLKSKQSPKYHEIYSAPNNRRTTFFFDTRSYPVIEDKEPYADYKCASQVRGTLNNQNDIDKGWDTEMAIPIKMLEEYAGIRFDSKGQWTILVARYNYIFGSPANPDFSTVPQLPVINYHLFEYYATIKFADARK